MCGRFTLEISSETLKVIFGVSPLENIPPRYNIAPTQLVLVLRNDLDNNRQLSYLKWGLIPYWAKDAAIGNHMINARSETVDQKLAFKSAFKHRRCIIPASGFYEWQKVEGKKRPHYITLKDGSPMMFAGLWDRWTSPEGNVIESCTILTTISNELIQTLHDRMPVVLRMEDADYWLDSRITDPSQLRQLFSPYQPDLLNLYPVSNMVNSPRNDDLKCIKPLSPTQDNLPEL